MANSGHDPAEGNYLRKSRRNFNLSIRCWELLHRLSLELGVNHSNVIELAVREMHQKYIGPVKPVEPRDIAHKDFFPGR